MERKIKVVKREDASNTFIERHEVSLLELLIAKHPDRARTIINRIREFKKAA